MRLGLSPKRQNRTMPNPILTIPTSLLPAVRLSGLTADDAILTL
jgi:hypothetical protein